MGTERKAKRAERDAKIVALIVQRPDLSYEEIANEVGISKSVISKLATEHGIQRVRGPNALYFAAQSARRRGKRTTYCYHCTILLDKIAEGVAVVQLNGVERTICQDCVVEYGMAAIRWERPPLAKRK